jgi:hypothetical protein
MHLPEDGISERSALATFLTGREKDILPSEIPNLYLQRGVRISYPTVRLGITYPKRTPILRKEPAQSYQLSLRD